MYLRKFSLSSTVFLVFILTLCLYIPALASEGRDSLIEKELNCVSSRLADNGELVWEDVCYTYEYSGLDLKRRQHAIKQALDSADSSDTMHIMESEETAPEPAGYKIKVDKDKIEFDVEDTDEAEAPPVRELKPVKPRKRTADQSSVFSNTFKKSKFDFGGEVYYFKYDEPTWGYPVRWDGEFGGFFASYTYRFFENQPLKSFSDTFGRDSKINMVRFEGRAAWGETDYEGGSTKYKGINDHTVEVRGMLGYDIPLENKFLATPYMGFGYRYYYDGFEDVGSGGYDRESNYWYLPIGVDLAKELDARWSFETSLEYDLFLWGKQISHLEDVNQSDSSLINKQDKGYGLRGSFRAVRQLETIAVFCEPFMRYWNIEDSKISSSALTTGQEPKNNTTEWGLRLGIRY